MKTIHPKEFKVMALRDCPVPSDMLVCETPQQVADYWRLHIATAPIFNPECECMAVLMLNTRNRVKGHQLLTIGTLDTILVHPREVFRCAIIAAAAKIALANNHPSCVIPHPVLCRMAHDLSDLDLVEPFLMRHKTAVYHNDLR